jgi:hypothetical protein
MFIEIFPLILLSCVVFYPFHEADDRLAYDDDGVSVTCMLVTFFVTSTSSGSMSHTKRVLL